MEPQPQRKPERAFSPAQVILTGVLGLIFNAVFWYFLVGLLHYVVESRFVTILQYVMALLTAASVAGISWQEYRQAVTARRASAANKHVEEVLSHIVPVQAATLSVDDLAKSMTGTGVSDDHLKRLVQQGVQKKLIDEDFEDDVRKLIVLYLQPLPRNAKRVLNRFRVNKVIAANRRLFDTKPTVEVTHLGKWLVLGERWPQLARVLNAAPERIELLEKQAKSSAPPPGAATTIAAPAAGAGAPAAPIDPFMDSIRLLAPFYVGDEDLRIFINSEPRLSVVLPRLVYHGTASSGLTTSAPPN